MDIDTSSISASRRNLVVLSMGFILFSLGEATLGDGTGKTTITILAGSITFNNPDILVYFSWAMFGWFFLRFWQFSKFESDCGVLLWRNQPVLAVISLCFGSRHRISSNRRRANQLKSGPRTARDHVKWAIAGAEDMFTCFVRVTRPVCSGFYPHKANSATNGRSSRRDTTSPRNKFDLVAKIISRCANLGRLSAQKCLHSFLCEYWPIFGSSSRGAAKKLKKH